MPPEGRRIGPLVQRPSTGPVEWGQAAGVGEELDEPDVDEELVVEELLLSLELDVLLEDSLFEPFWLRLSVR
jgi:hypothetical protein